MSKRRTSTSNRQASTSDVEPRRQSIAGVDQICSATGCGKKLTTLDYVMWCKRCGKGVHSQCLGMKDPQFKTFQNLERFVTYHCQSCQVSINNMDKRLKALETEMEAFKRGTTGATGEQVPPNISPGPGFNVDIIKEIVVQVLDVLLPKLGDMVQEAVSETVEKDRKKLNLVLVGATEQSPTEDKENVEKMCGVLGVDEQQVVDVFRTGKTVEGKSRIQKIKFKDSQSKHRFLVGFYRNRTSVPGYEDCFVRHDMTYKERQRDFALRKQCKELREEGKNVKIAKGKIVEKEQGSLTFT